MKYKIINTASGLITMGIAASIVAAALALRPDIDNEQHKCMALNIYHEARGEVTEGQIAVAQVTVNRVQDKRWPNTICDVVYQGKKKPSWKDPERMVMVRDACQFSWYCDGKVDEPIIHEDNIKWKVAEDIAYQVLAFNKWSGMVEGATHYHADYVRPDWAKTKTKTIEIEDHIFYRWEK